MLNKWDVSPAPTDKNPTRHKLLIKGEMKDIFLIVKKLGSICSRPEKTTGDFNFVIYLSKLEMDTMKKLKSVAEELSSPAAEEASLGGAAAPFEAPKPKLKPAPATQPQRPPEAAPAPAAPAAKVSAEEAAPFEAPKPKLKTEPSPQPAASQRPAVQQSPAAVPRPAQNQGPAPEPAPAAPAPAADSPAVTRPPAQRPGMNFVPSSSARAMKDELAKTEAVPPLPAAAPAPSASAKIKTKWPMELPLIPTYSFQTLQAGSHNRFAHAAAMAVVENPGVIYNPLLLFGNPGTGKTHFVNAVSYGLSAAIGQNNIFVTDGIKFSKGVEVSIKDGSIASLEAMMAKTKVLIIDDVHLLMISEANKKYISKWLNDFVAQNKQIVVTTVFPPKALAGLEEAVGFEFTQGWMVDLKPPASQAYKAILAQLLQGRDVKLSDEEMSSLFAAGPVPFNEVSKALEDMKKLEKFVVNAMNSVSHAQLLDMLLGHGETVVAGAVTEEDARQASSWQPAKLEQAWFKWGLFYPKGMRREAQFALYSLHERARELGLNTDWSQVFMEEYNSDELYGIPFKIGNFASEKEVNGIIVLGPQPSSALGAQEAEFRHITFKILDSFLIKGAWLSPEKLKSKAAYTKMLMDLI